MKTLCSVVLVFILMAAFVDAETYKYRNTRDELTYDLELSGPFGMSRIVNPGDVLFSGIGNVLPESGSVLIGDKRQYAFLGRSGDKTFDIELMMEGNGVAETTTKKLKIYFNKEEPVHLPLAFLAAYTSKCTVDDFISMKMLSLKGNTLKVQLSLPVCLENTEGK